MNKFILITTMLILSITCFGQEKETVSEQFHYIYLKPEDKIEQIKKENEVRQRTWQDDFNAMKAGLGDGQRVSDNVKIDVNTAVQQEDDEINLVVAVSYETISLVVDEADDYALGKYAVQHSNACKLMCKFLKTKMEGELAQFLKKGKRVDVRITGATDGTPIRSKIPYEGEYGDIVNKPIILNGDPFNMTVTKATGITTNGQLAFLRTQGVENYMKRMIETLKQTTNTFQCIAIENKEKGGGYRRVSVEITIHNAFQEDKPSN